jgi:hypothetical protein
MLRDSKLTARLSLLSGLLCRGSWNCLLKGRTCSEELLRLDIPWRPAGHGELSISKVDLR